MASKNIFHGFSKETIAFYQGLRQDNSKRWFEENRKIYDQYVMEPARDFVAALGERLRQIAPQVHADPRVNQSIFRINRDTRFTHDKSPYKTHLGLWLWEGPQPRMENSGFYFHLEPPTLMLGIGLYIFPDPMLYEYRATVMHPKHGAELVRAIKRVQERGYDVGEQRYKKTPRGFDPNHKHAELLLYNGLWAGLETKVPKEFYSAALVDYCFEHYRRLLPLHKWLLAFTLRATAAAE